MKVESSKKMNQNGRFQKLFRNFPREFSGPAGRAQFINFLKYEVGNYLFLLRLEDKKDARVEIIEQFQSYLETDQLYFPGEYISLIPSNFEELSLIELLWVILKLDCRFSKSSRSEIDLIELLS